MVRKHEYVRRRLLFVCAALLLGGCSVLPVPDLRRVTIRSDPPGAEVLANGETIGATPLAIVPDKVFRPRVDWQNLEYRAMGVLALHKAGCKPYSERVNDAVLSKDITVKLDCSVPVAVAPAASPPGSTAASAVTVPAAQPAPAPGAATVTAFALGVEARLRRLEKLYKDGLITEKEYRSIRARILNRL